jgi:hypothetical protein
MDNSTVEAAAIYKGSSCRTTSGIISGLCFNATFPLLWNLPARSTKQLETRIVSSCSCGIIANLDYPTPVGS